MNPSRAYLRSKAFLERQLSFDFLYGKRLIRSVKRGFIWIRPDRRQVWCPSISALKAAVQRYSPRLALGLLYQAMRLRNRGGVFGAHA